MNLTENTGTVLLTRVQKALASGSITDAEKMLAEAIQRNPNDVNAWWVRAIIARSPEEQRVYLRHVLWLEPDHKQAREALDILLQEDLELNGYMDRLRQSILAPMNPASEIAAPSSSSDSSKISDSEYPHNTSVPPINPATMAQIDQPSRYSYKDARAADNVQQYASPNPGFEISRSLVTDTDQTAMRVKGLPAVHDEYPDSGTGGLCPWAVERRLSPSLPNSGATPHLDKTYDRSQGTTRESDVIPPNINISPAQFNVNPASTIATSVFPPQGYGVRFLDRVGVWPVALTYLVGLTLAEAFTVFINVRVGILVHMGILFLLLFHTARRLESPDHRLWASLSLVPLIRIISLSLPLAGFALFYWFFWTSVPLFAATFITMRLLSMSWNYVGVSFRAMPAQLLISFLGFGLGYIEYLILEPAPLIDELTPAKFWWPALIIIVSTGFLEELLFRGVLQGTSVELLGRMRGIIYVAIIFGVLHIGYNSLTDVIFVTFVGIIFGWLVLKTKSIIGVTVAHGITNIMLFLIMPFVANGSVSLPY